MMASIIGLIQWMLIIQLRINMTPIVKLVSIGLIAIAIINIGIESTEATNFLLFLLIMDRVLKSKELL